MHSNRRIRDAYEHNDLWLFEGEDLIDIIKSGVKPSLLLVRILKSVKDSRRQQL